MSLLDLPNVSGLVTQAFRQRANVKMTPRAAQAVLKEHAERHLRNFGKWAWKVVEPSTEYRSNFHIDAVCDHLEACSKGQIKKLLINMPPRCGKSLWVDVFWPAWEWLRRPHTRWLFASYSQRLSIKHSMACRDVVQSQWYRERWGDRFDLRKDQNTKSRFDNTKSGFRLASSVGGVATGEGGDFIVFDDPHNTSHNESNARREVVTDWWDQSMSTRGNDPKTACYVGVMQRLHQGDLSGHVLRNGEWEHLVLPMEYDPKRSKVTSLGWKDPRTEEGQLLWPERFGQEQVDSIKKSLGPYGTAGQFGQNPVPTGGAIFAQGDFRYFRMEVLDGADREKMPRGHLPAVFELMDDEAVVRRYFAWDCYWFQTCDTANKTRTVNDYTVVGTFAVTPDGDLLVFDIYRARIEIPNQYDFLISQRGRYPFLEFQGVEDAASGTGLIQQAAKDGNPFRALSPLGDKVSGSQNIATMYGNHKVFHLSGAPWGIEFEPELTIFPRGDHDDQVDVMSYAGKCVVTRAITTAGAHTIDPNTAPTLEELLGR